MVCDVITWRHKGKTIKYRPSRRLNRQNLSNHSCVIHQMKDIYSEISNIFKFLIYDVITWRHKGKTTKYRRFRRLKWQQLCNYSSVLHQMRGLYSDNLNRFIILIYDVIMWRHKGKTTKYRRFMRSKWQKYYSRSRTMHQMKDIQLEISKISDLWRIFFNIA